MQNPFIACGGLLGLAMAVGIDQYRDWSARRAGRRLNEQRAVRAAIAAAAHDAVEMGPPKPVICLPRQTRRLGPFDITTRD
jgi:hypothetical protein